MSSKALHYFYVVLGAISWGFIGVFNRILSTFGINVFEKTIIRNLGSFLVMTILFAIVKPTVFHIEKKDIPIFLGTGVISVVCLGLTYFNCQMYCSLAVAGILLYLAPSFVVLMSRIFWKEPLTDRKIIALVFALVGCALVSGVADGIQHVSLLGILFGIASGFCYSTYTVFSHYGLKHYDAYTMIYWTFLVAGLTSIFFIPVIDFGHFALVFTDKKGLLGALGLIFIGTVIPYFFYTKGLEGVEGSKAVTIANIEPIVAALTGIVFYGEILSIWTIFGICCIFSGIFVLSNSK